MSKTVLRFGHSPDADDAYMFYALANGLLDTQNYKVELELAEIEQLNQRAMAGDLEITAVSAHAYAFIADRYAILGCGASVARGYGPRVVACRNLAPADLGGLRIAVPGHLTTAYLLAQIMLPSFHPVFSAFDKVEDALMSGDCDAAILIHEGQIQVEERGYHLVGDLGAMFYDQTRLPVPLGLDVVRRDIGQEAISIAYNALYESIRIAREQHGEALSYAMPFGRDIDRPTADRFVRMYVNDDTVDLPADAVQGLQELYDRARRRGLLPRVPPIDIIRGS